MKFLVIAAFIACASAAVVPDNTASIVRSDSQSSPEGNYQFSYETDNGIQAAVQGAVKAFGKDEVAVVVSGSNSYISPEGEKIDLVYVADENGFQPKGAHLPVPPPTQPIPDYIVRAIEYIKAHPSVEYSEKVYQKKN